MSLDAAARHGQPGLESVPRAGVVLACATATQAGQPLAFATYAAIGSGMETADFFDPMAEHTHVFLGEDHARAERRSWVVIWLCAVVMTLEIVGGLWFGSIALVADGLHMSTHAGALLLAAASYRYARHHADDPRYSFGTGKIGDLAGFASAIMLAMISLLIGWEAVGRLLAPAPIRFGEAIPIACLGLAVNVLSAWLLGGGHDHGHDAHDHHHGHAHAHGKAGRDNTMRAAVVHVFADALVSALVILGLILARAFGWVWLDPVAALIGAFVVASWAAGLVRDTASILLDMNPDAGMTALVRQEIETDGDRVSDLHVWRLGPGHLGVIVAVATSHGRDAGFYGARLRHFRGLSHVTVEVRACS